MKVRVKAAEVSNYSEGIVLIQFLPSVGLEVADAEEVIAAVVRVADGKLHGNLVDARDLLFMTNEARARFGRQSPPSLSATAVIVGSSVQRALGNVYLSVARPANPTRLFSKMEEAVRFLQENNRRSVRTSLLPLSASAFDVSREPPALGPFPH